ncbi:MAG: hypothetical protein JO263_10675 [Candidatus Eremiobacteraeota bacterium]|nr:hypothetical protein [Candidatus Eremiobacteraeota bacterium]
MATLSARLVCSIATAAMLAGCAGGAAPPPLTGSGASLGPSSPLHLAGRRSVGLGKILSSKSGAQIFGFDVNRSGTDGLLATANDTTSDVETFDQGSATITGSYPTKNPPGKSYKVDAIVAGDVGLVTRYVVPKGKIYAKRFYDVMNPVTSQKFTAGWKPPIRDIDILQAGVNQTKSKNAYFAIELKNQDQPDVIVADVASTRPAKVFHLDPNLFGGGNGPQFDIDTGSDQGVIALSPDGGRVGGAAPVNVLVDLKTGKQTQFTGLNNGFYGSGYVNGLAVDSATGIAATTTELNAQVEFYDLAKQTGTFAQLPCTSNVSQINSGAGVAADPVNHLFLVTEPYNACGQGSALLVYDESGNLVESITGFKFAIGEPAPAINPTTRTGFAFGPQFSQLQQFFY